MFRPRALRWGLTLERPRGAVFERFDHDLSVPLHAEEAIIFLTILTEYRNADGKLVVEQRSVTVTTNRSPADDDWKPKVPDYAPVDPFAAFQR
ncbi:hypothetical protein, partial [Pseudorhodobacter sp.]|uniref:hypothetical protein n=1 Tax=Pseudorhodobacter sp. TaxID=1934400 RepID=UPI0026496946